MRPQELITINDQVLGGRPVFKGTRVPVESLIWHLEKAPHWILSWMISHP